MRILLAFFLSSVSWAAPSVSNVLYPASVGQYLKYEITFDVTTAATNLYFPYDASPPSGVDPTNYPLYSGVSVDGLFSSDNWTTTYTVPAFYYYGFDEDTKDGNDWYYPNGSDHWKVRFSPNSTGTWKFKIRATDSTGTTTTSETAFTVTTSGSKGFLKISNTDTRYFEYSSGSPFIGFGVQVDANNDNPEVDNGPLFATLGTNGMNFLRLWQMAYGAAWLDWIGDDNHYDGYLPRSGLEPYQDGDSKQWLTLRLAQGSAWYDACRGEFWGDTPAVKQSTNYRIAVEYQASSITGPRGSGSYGLVIKHSTGFLYDGEDSGTGTVISSYGGNASTWTTLSGTWASGSSNFAPRFHVALENVSTGTAYIRSISMKEDLGGGNYGPELFRDSSQQYETFVPKEAMFAFDKTVELAEQNSVYLKVVLLEKGDIVWYKLDDDGTWVIGVESDNEDGVYGTGRSVNKTRWLQQAWWRYAQARWGYSTAIHSWELMNEGDPNETKHWQMADEFGKYMKCRVFGEAIGTSDSQQCTYQHPNKHMVTTSFWYGWPTSFWGSANYPNVDYADLHAYISTGPGTSEQKATMEDSSEYQHLFVADYYDVTAAGRPFVRGETGVDFADGSGQQSDIQLDTTGVWYHNWLWAQIAPFAMYDLYWYTNEIWGGSFDHRDEAKNVQNFLSGLPLNNGNYANASATGTSGLRIIGQKDLANNKAHLWIQNNSHTWRNVVDSTPITPITGTASVTMNADVLYQVNAWNTYTGVSSSGWRVRADGSGTVTIPINSLSTDFAVQLSPATGAGKSMSGRSQRKGRSR